MAVKSVIDIEINDQEFQRFTDSFKKYQEMLSRTPGVWKEASEGAKSTGLNFEKLTAALLAQTELSHHLTAEHTRSAAAVEKQASAWRTMARDTKDVASHIVTATRSLLRWASLTSIFTGLLGVGGLFGIERLAMSAGNMRRSALGLGVTPGEQRAFGVNFGRVVNPGSFLGGVNEALHDVTKRVGLYGAGLTQGDIAGQDTAQVGATLLQALKRIADQTPEAMMAQVLQARHLDQFVTLEEFQRLRNTPASEIGQYGDQFRRDIRTLDLTKQQQKAWQDLQVQLTRAGESIETAFIRGLTPLAPQLEKLSKAFTDVITSLLSNPDIRQWMDDLAAALGRFATYVGTPEFATNVATFVHGIGELAKSVGVIFGWVKDPGSFNPDAGVNGPMRTWPGSPEWERTHPRPPVNGPMETWPGGPRWQGNSGGDESQNRFSSLETQYGLPRGMLDLTAYHESRYNQNAVGAMTSTGTAKGMFQMMDDTARHYGVTNPFDPSQEATGAAKLYADLLREFGGDREKALAAYAAGSGFVEKDIAQYGANWRAHLKPEAQEFLNWMLPRLARAEMQRTAARGGTRVDIHNNTGGSAIVAASQLA